MDEEKIRAQEEKSKEEEKELQKELEMFKRAMKVSIPVIDEALASSKIVGRYLDLLEGISVSLEKLANK